MGVGFAEQDLLELSDRIGYVSTGLRDEEITRCLGRTKLAVSTDLSLHFASEMERKCSICQVKYLSCCVDSICLCPSWI